MADKRVEWFLGEIAAWNRGERDVPEDRLADDFELHSRILGEVGHGPEGLAAWFREVDQQFDAWKVRVNDEIGAGGDRFMIVGEVRLKGRGSGLELDQDVAWVLDFEGDALRQMRLYTDVDQARSEAGPDVR